MFALQRKIYVKEEAYSQKSLPRPLIATGGSGGLGMCRELGSAAAVGIKVREDHGK